MQKLPASVAVALALVALGSASYATTPVETRSAGLHEALAQKDRAFTRYHDYLLIASAGDGKLTRYYFSRPSHPAYPAWMRLTVRATGQTDRIIRCDTCENNYRAVADWYDWGKSQTTGLRSALAGRRF